MRRCRTLAAVLIGLLCLPLAAAGQEPGDAAGVAPGDEAIQAHLAALSAEFSERFLDGVTSAEDWWTLRPRYLREYLYMLGLWPRSTTAPTTRSGGGGTRAATTRPGWRAGTSFAASTTW